MPAPKSTMTTTSPVEGTLILPDEQEFQRPANLASVEGPHKVVGLDYDKWASAVIDLGGKPERIASHRLMLARKGYRKVDGSPVVNGVGLAEVWVKPRSQWEQDREARHARILRLIDEGILTDAANVHPQVTRGTKK